MQNRGQKWLLVTCWQYLFLKINKHGVPNKAMQVGKKSQKRKRNMTRLLGTSEYILWFFKRD